MQLALVGTPNSGKTSLFNALTGSRQKVANYPGVTVERKEGSFVTPEGRQVSVVDLPGTYSLRGRSPDEEITRDIHCVTKWSKFDTVWRGVSVDTLLAGVSTAAGYLTAWSDGGYTTNLPLDDVTDGKAWVAYEYAGEPLHPEHGGPARLLVPHLYFWKSAKWVRGLNLTVNDEPGFWETYGYHNRGDPWLEQRYQGD